jgi:MSHA biogenesis protein MshI
MLWFKQSTQQSWTAIRSIHDSIMLAQVRMGGSKPYVVFAAIEAGNVHDNDTLRALTAQYKLKQARCSFVLEIDDYQMLQLETPNVPIDEQKAAVRWKLKDMIDYPVDEAMVDILEIPQDPAYQNKQGYVYAVVAKNALVGKLANQFIEVGSVLHAIDVRVIGQRNIAAYLELENRGLAMLSFSAKGALLTFTFAGELYHARFIEIEEQRIASAVERIALELQRSLDHFDRQFPFVNVSKLVVAPFVGRDALVEHLRSALYLPVESFALSDIFDFSERVQLPDLTTQARLFPVLGAALREEVIA